MAALLLVFGAPALKGQALFNGLIGHWTFDEAAGTTVADSSAQGNNGILFNGGSAWIAGIYGSALYFPGVVGTGSTRVVMASTPALESAFTNSITVAAWVRVDNLTIDAPILAKEGPAGLSFWFGAFGLNAEGATPGNFGLLLDSGGGQPWDMLDRNQGNISQGVWVHIASTWDGTQVTHYLNGVQIAGGATYSGSIGATTDILAIGVNAGYYDQGPATAFNGAIDDLYVYNRPLSGSEIVLLMNGAAIPEPSVAAILAGGLAILAVAGRWRRI
jgi:hypothetical protein